LVIVRVKYIYSTTPLSRTPKGPKNISDLTGVRLIPTSS